MKRNKQVSQKEPKALKWQPTEKNIGWLSKINTGLSLVTFILIIIIFLQ